jgi:general secretion pathway protein A
MDGKGTESGYALVEGLNFNYALLNLGKSKVQVPLTQLDPYWTGDYLIIWQPPLANTTVIGPRASGESVRWLRYTLSLLPGWVASDTESPVFDQALKLEVQRFQRHRGLVPDGIVGPETLIHLNTAARVPGTPRLKNIP